MNVTETQEKTPSQGVGLPMIRAISETNSYHFPVERNLDGSLSDKSRKLVEKLIAEGLKVMF